MKEGIIAEMPWDEVHSTSTVKRKLEYYKRIWGSKSARIVWSHSGPVLCLIFLPHQRPPNQTVIHRYIALLLQTIIGSRPCRGRKWASNPDGFYIKLATGVKRTSRKSDLLWRSEQSGLHFVIFGHFSLGPSCSSSTLLPKTLLPVCSLGKLPEEEYPKTRKLHCYL